VVIRELNRLAKASHATNQELDALLDQVAGRPTPCDEAAFRDFMENFRKHVRLADERSIRILELSLEGHTAVEIRDMLGISRGQLYRSQEGLRRELVLALLGQENPQAGQALRMHERGADEAQIAADLDVSEEWVRMTISAVKRLMGKTLTRTARLHLRRMSRTGPKRSSGVSEAAWKGHRTFLFATCASFSRTWPKGQPKRYSTIW
jgi:DNA-binding CsgD family transcriptional regulator